MDSLDLRSSNPIVLLSIPSIVILPPSNSIIRNRTKAKEDLPKESSKYYLY